MTDKTTISPIGTEVVLDTPIGKAAAKENSRYSCDAVKYSSGYVMATDGKIAAVRQTERGTSAQDGVQIPNKAATPGTATLQGSTWTTQKGKGKGNRKAKTTPALEPSEKKFPPLAEIFGEANGTFRWLRLDADLLRQVIEAITPKDADGIRGITIGFPDDGKAGVKSAAHLLADDGRGLGLIMPRKSLHRDTLGAGEEVDHTSEKWNQACKDFQDAVGLPRP